MNNKVTQQVALYTTSIKPDNFTDGFYTGFPTLIVYNGENKYPENDPDWIRVSDIVEIKFHMLSQDCLNRDEVSRLKKKRTILQAKTEMEIIRITAQIQELQALPAP